MLARRGLPLLVAGVVLCGRGAGAVDITGSWALCLVASGPSPACSAGITGTLDATSTTFTIAFPDLCTITGTVDQTSGTLTPDPGQCPSLLGFALTATDTSIGGTLDLATGCDPFTVNGVKACGACDPPPGFCVVGGCGNTACSFEAPSCTYAPRNGGTCDDGNACTTTATCDHGLCSGPSDVACNDDNPCTDDACVPEIGCVFTPNTSPCSDGDACTNGDTCSGGTCVPGPAVTCAPCRTCDTAAGCVVGPKGGCKHSTVPAKNKLLLKDSPGDTTDRVAWTWGGGEETDSVEFGDPRTTEDYTLCIFDDVLATSRLVIDATAPAASTCPFGPTGTPCWSARGTPAGNRGFVYKNRGLLTPDGLKQLTLSPGVDGKAKIEAKGQGANLALPSPMNLTLPLTVQLQTENGTCWEAAYTSARINREDELKATGSP
jgi:hypothetical protein